MVRKSQKRLNRKLLFAWILFFLGGIFYLLLFSPLFRVEEIFFQGLKKINEKDLRIFLEGGLDDNLFYFFPQNNLLAFSEEKIRGLLKEQFPEIAEIRIRRNFPHGLEFSIEERKPIALFCGLKKGVSTPLGLSEILGLESEESKEVLPPKEIFIKKCFYLDKEGVIFKKAPRLEGNEIVVLGKESEDLEMMAALADFPRIEFIDAGIFRLGEKVIDNQILAAILEIKDKLDPAGDSYRIKSPLTQELRTLTIEGWEIIFDLSKDISLQLSFLNTLLKKEIKPAERKNLEYIDLRLGNKVYYKMK